MITKPKMHLGKPVIRPGETYLVDGIAYKIITATSEIIGGSRGSIAMTELVYILRNTATEEREFMRESVLIAKLTEAMRNDE